MKYLIFNKFFIELLVLFQTKIWNFIEKLDTYK